MTVDEKRAAGTATHGDKTYYFCAAACRDKFVKDPRRYVEVREEK